MNSDLEGVIAAETRLSHVDGAAGRLIIAGMDVEALAGRHGYEAVASLLWRLVAPETPDAAALGRALGAARVEAASLLPGLLLAGSGLSPVEGLRAGLAMLADGAGDGDRVRLAAAVPVFTAALWRHGRGEAPVAPDPALGQVADFLRMLHGAPASRAQVEALEAYLVTVSDHGLNASTFTARIVASTRAGLVSSVVAALCALKGPLHGGAPGPVLDMLDTVAASPGIRAWIEAQLASGERLMGFGHRVYRTRDPRADVLKAVLARLGAGGGARIALAEALEREALAVLAERHPGRRLDTNVEFYTALVLEAAGLPRELFTPAFAMGRVLGWTAHAMEQAASGRLIRPSSRYVGPMPEEPVAVAR